VGQAASNRLTVFREVIMIPRFGSESMGAERLGLPLATFRHWVRIGRLPGPVPDLDLYDLKALDAACDRMSGL
jgi:hypothetical protein